MIWTLKDIDFKDKHVFIRVDFNVPVCDGKVQDDTRIVEALPTIRYVLEHGGKPVLGAHFGRPKGERNLKYSLKDVVQHIKDKNYFIVHLLNDCIGEEVNAAIAAQKSGEVLMLENLRFYPGEEKNDPEFVKQLAKPFDIYVNDAFGVSHRKHASVYGVPAIMHHKCAGMLIEKEVACFDKIVNAPERPFIAILGGAKVSDKVGVINSLIDKADRVIIGGAMAYTFLKALGYNTGTSLIEANQLGVAEEIIAKAKEHDGALSLPIDHIVSDTFCGNPEMCPHTDIPDGKMGLDIGPQTIKLYQALLSEAKTIVWNGPMGVFEQKAYACGTFSIARYISDLNAMTVVGGGDSVSATKQAGVAGRITHISTGGGASLEYIEYGSLPGIDILRH